MFRRFLFVLTAATTFLALAVFAAADQPRTQDELIDALALQHLQQTRVRQLLEPHLSPATNSRVYSKFRCDPSGAAGDGSGSAASAKAAPAGSGDAAAEDPVCALNRLK
jgi:hypothetical protein